MLIGRGVLACCERVAEAMNTGAWHDLRRLYEEQGDSLQTPFLHPLSKFFLFHFYNRPDSALHYGGLLLERYQAELGESVPSTMYLMAEDCARLGDYAGAADLLHQLGEAFKQAGADTPPVFLGFEGQYRVMAGHGALRVERLRYTAFCSVFFSGAGAGTRRFSFTSTCIVP